VSLDSFDESFGTLYKCASARTSSGCNSLGSRTNVSCACLYPLRIAINPKTNISIMQQLRRSRTRTSVCDWPFVPIFVGSNRQRGFRERLFLVPFAVNAVRTGIYLRRRMKELCLRSKVNPPNNALRHSYASYWLARSSKEGLGELSKRMGNSEAICKRHYLETLTREEGKSWFALRRSTGAS